MMTVACDPVPSVEIVAALKGGGRVRKTAYQKKRVMSSDAVLTVLDDKSIFENAFQACLATSSGAGCNFVKAIQTLPQQNQQNILDMLTSDTRDINSAKDWKDP